jgi:hypothetical protein
MKLVEGGSCVAQGLFVTGSLVLKSNVELHVMAGCRLVGSTSLDDYDELTADGFRTENAPERSAQSLVRAVDAENVAITGPGELDGSGLAFYDTEKRKWTLLRQAQYTAAAPGHVLPLPECPLRRDFICRLAMLDDVVDEV